MKYMRSVGEGEVTRVSMMRFGVTTCTDETCWIGTVGWGIAIAVVMIGFGFGEGEVEMEVNEATFWIGGDRILFSVMWFGTKAFIGVTY